MSSNNNSTGSLTKAKTTATMRNNNNNFVWIVSLAITTVLCLQSTTNAAPTKTAQAEVSFSLVYNRNELVVAVFRMSDNKQNRSTFYKNSCPSVNSMDIEPSTRDIKFKLLYE